MKVSDLIALLQQQDQDLEVHQTQPSHDYWNNMLAPATIAVEVGRIDYSEYHSEWKVELRDDAPLTSTTVLFLRNCS